jgi:hypothetical protein
MKTSLQKFLLSLVLLLVVAFTAKAQIGPVTVNWTDYCSPVGTTHHYHIYLYVYHIPSNTYELVDEGQKPYNLDQIIFQQINFDCEKDEVAANYKLVAIVERHTSDCSSTISSGNVRSSSIRCADLYGGQELNVNMYCE